MKLFFSLRKYCSQASSLQSRRLFLSLALIFAHTFFSPAMVQAELTVTSTVSSDEQKAPSTASLASDRALTRQRQLYKKVNKDLRRGATASFKALRSSLETYPLYPYLLYSRISGNIRLSNEALVADFLRDYPTLPVTRKLRKRWLHLLYKRQQWQKLLYYYDPATSSSAQQCEYQYARYKSGHTNAALSAALPLWSVGKSQPKACDPLFKLLIDRGHITEAVAWQRYTRAIFKHQFQLAHYIERFFTSAAYRDKAALYRTVDRQPALVGNYSRLSADRPDNRALIEHAIVHLARQNATQAIKHWEHYRQSHRFDEASQGRVLARLIKGLHKQDKHAAALNYINANIVVANSTLLEWQLRILLRDNNWQVIKPWIHSLPEAIRTQQRWRYWQARAQLMTSGDPEVIDQAKTTFRELSRFRSFYGFLASDRVGNPYRMAQHPLPLKTDEIDALAKTPALQRVREFFIQGENLRARREWYQATKNFSTEQWLIAAQLAHREHWYQQAILAMSKARYWDDIDIRFPQAYRREFEKQAQEMDLPLSLLFAISRQESAFAADVTSPAGAKGLMQLMPATAKQVARQHNIRYKSSRQLFQPSKNLSLGSRYYKDMMLRFADNRILATASYNAGPHRVARWRKESAGKLTYDVWIETIPYSETRQYVQNVLAYCLIFAHHLEQTLPLLSPAEKQQLL